MNTINIIHGAHGYDIYVNGAKVDKVLYFQDERKDGVTTVTMTFEVSELHET